MMLSMAYTQHLWLTGAFKELHKSSFATTLTCNNKGTVDLIYNPRISDRSKYINMAYHYLRDSIKEEKLVVIHVSSKQNLVDIYTKGMPGSRFTYFNNKIIYSKLWQVRNSLSTLFSL